MRSCGGADSFGPPAGVGGTDRLCEHHRPNVEGGLMYEIFTYGRFEVEPESEHAFIEAGRSSRPG